MDFDHVPFVRMIVPTPNPAQSSYFYFLKVKDSSRFEGRIEDLR